MEKEPLSGSEQKIQEYINRIKAGESKDSILQDLPPSFIAGIEAGISEPEKPSETKEDNFIISEADKESIELANKERYIKDQKRIEELRGELGIIDKHREIKIVEGIPINYVEIVIDDEFMQKNLMPDGNLRMKGGQANWNGKVDLMKYVISKDISPEYRKIAEEKIEKKNATQEKTYQHESHHIKNRENGLTPHMIAENQREFLTFRVLDELSAFATGELYDKDLTPENILTSLQKAKQDIENSYFGKPFINDASWYVSQNSNKPEVFSRKIDEKKYHQIMKHYFQINGRDILNILAESGKIPEFTKIVNELILRLDDIINLNN
jgi:hypothetical protein